MPIDDLSAVQAAAARRRRPAALLGALAFALALAAAGSARAERPFVTDDAAVPEGGTCELESSVARVRARDQASERVLQAQFGCGIGWRTKLGLGVDRLRADADRSDAVIFNGKTALTTGVDGAPALALAYAVSGVRPRGGDWDHASSTLALLATERRGAFAFHGNLSVTRDEIARDNVLTWGFAAEQRGARFDVGVEVYGEERRSPWLGLGARFAMVPERFSIDAYVAQQTNSARARRVAAGIKLVF
ncbi:MAG: hypothetical protein NZL99_01795 [Burkholderiaceae bacterium]|nr:hypothetical protein [Burkholderiaceae bacterium]MCX7902735.1 hypothetical protein [Burkholderiaceae bacterium]